MPFSRHCFHKNGLWEIETHGCHGKHHLPKPIKKKSSEVSTKKENVETIPEKVVNDTNTKGAKKETLGSGIEETKNENNDNVDSKEEDDVKDANEVEEESFD